VLTVIVSPLLSDVVSGCRRVGQVPIDPIDDARQFTAWRSVT
jgi:hypothetical protein